MAGGCQRLKAKRPSDARPPHGRDPAPAGAAEPQHPQARGGGPPDPGPAPDRRGRAFSALLGHRDGRRVECEAVERAPEDLAADVAVGGRPRRSPETRSRDRQAATGPSARLEETTRWPQDLGQPASPHDSQAVPESICLAQGAVGATRGEQRVSKRGLTLRRNRSNSDPRGGSWARVAVRRLNLLVVALDLLRDLGRTRHGLAGSRRSKCQCLHR